MTKSRFTMALTPPGLRSRSRAFCLELEELRLKISSESRSLV